MFLPVVPIECHCCPRKGVCDVPSVNRLSGVEAMAQISDMRFKVSHDVTERHFAGFIGSLPGFRANFKSGLNGIVSVEHRPHPYLIALVHQLTVLF
jgi:hypothetical protein